MRRRLARSTASLRTDDCGLSLIEVIVSVTLFALVAAATGAMVLTGIGVSRDARNRTAAALAASQGLESARQLATTTFTQLTIPSAPAQVVVNNLPFTVTQTATFIPKNAPSGSCSATGQGGSSGVQPVLLVTETVTWPRMDSTKPVTVSTTLTPPVGAYPDGTGGLDVKVIDRDGAPVAGVPITIAGPTTTSASTSAAGCVYAAFLTPATYTVSASLPGYVDNQEQATSTQPAGVLNGQTTALTVYYDRAATVDAVLATSVTVPPATGLPITIGNSGLAGTGSVSYPSGTVRLTPLYPYSSYGIWAGRCPEAYPAAVAASNTLLWSPSSVTAVTPVSNQVVTRTVPLYPLTVTVRRNGNNGQGSGGGTTNVNGATLAVTETAGAAKTPCGAPFSTYGLSASQRVGTIDGVSMTGLPLGTFTLVVTYQNQTSGPLTVIIGPGGTSLTVTL